MKPEDIPQEVWRAAEHAFYDSTPNAVGAVEAIARAIMAAEKRGEEAAQAKMAALLKDPAAVRVNYLRGDIACQDLIREGEEREREACAKVAMDCRIEPEIDHVGLVDGANRACVKVAAAIRNRGKP